MSAELLHLELQVENLTAMVGELLEIVSKSHQLSPGATINPDLLTGLPAIRAEGEDYTPHELAAFEAAGDPSKRRAQNKRRAAARKRRESGLYQEDHK